MLALVFEDERLGGAPAGRADGSVELAVPPVPDQAGQDPFVLPTADGSDAGEVSRLVDRLAARTPPRIA